MASAILITFYLFLISPTASTILVKAMLFPLNKCKKMLSNFGFNGKNTPVLIPKN
jgi:predicted HAD superfamily hydrolase